jgi:hypothetical protein
MKSAMLILEDIEGTAVGVETHAMFELVINTG